MIPRTQRVLPTVEPIIVVLGSPPLHDPRWFYEPKFDGFRGVLYLCRGECYIRSKRSNVLRRFADLARRVHAELDVREAILHVFSATPDLVWSAVLQPETCLFEDVEVSWLYPEEIRLYGALTLAEPHAFDHGRYMLDPFTWPSPIALQELPDSFESEASLTALQQRALERAEAIGLEKIDPCRVRGAPELLNYGTPESIRELIDAVHVDDELVLRGISKLVMATQLLLYPPFMEEAGFAALVSLEAALECVRQHLATTSGHDTSYREAIAHVESVFPTGKHFAPWLEELYGHRVMVAHPSSHFGEYWAPPVPADGYYDAFYASIHMYRYVLLGEIWEPLEDEWPNGRNGLHAGSVTDRSADAGGLWQRIATRRRHCGRRD